MEDQTVNIVTHDGLSHRAYGSSELIVERLRNRHEIVCEGRDGTGRPEYILRVLTDALYVTYPESEQS